MKFLLDWNWDIPNQLKTWLKSWSVGESYGRGISGHPHFIQGRAASATAFWLVRFVARYLVAVGEVTTAITAISTTPATFRSISGFALPSMHRNNSPLL